MYDVHHMQYRMGKVIDTTLCRHSLTAYTVATLTTTIYILYILQSEQILQALATGSFI